MKIILRLWRRFRYRHRVADYARGVEIDEQLNERLTAEAKWHLEHIKAWRGYNGY